MKPEVTQAIEATGPPTFEAGRNRRQKARAAGMNPDYWYPAEHDRALKPGQVVEVVFWKRSFALFRGEDGQLRCIENRCAHRQLKLSLGQVNGCRLACGYHGWEYDGDGRVTHIPHDLFGRKMPKFKVKSLPVQERYGLIWIFPGDPGMASRRSLPEIPELEGPDAWPCVPFDHTWKAHHSMIVDNVSDFTHEYLHRKHRPFSDAKMTNMETTDDRVFVSYDTKVGGGEWMRPFINEGEVNNNSINLCYDYPYQWSDTDGKIKHWLFIMPIDERTSRAFFLFYFKRLKVPFLPLHIPRAVMIPLLKVANRLIFDPLLGEDGWAVEAEQEAYERFYDAPLAEINPAVTEFQSLTIRKWEEHLAKEAGQKRPRREPAPRS